jgi:hypothetical protein
MKSLLPSRFSIQAIGLTAILALSSATLVAQNSAPAAGQRSDGQIEMDVVHALDASQALKNDLITAATIQSQVTLAGTVSSDASRQLAESIVSKVQGVTKVNNNLKIGNPADAQNDPAAPDPNAQDDGTPSASTSRPPQYSQDDQNRAPNSQPDDRQQGSAAPPQNYPQQDYPQQNAPQQGYPQQGSNQGYPPPPPQNDRRGYNQGGYEQRGPNQRPEYAPPAYAQPTGPVMIPQGTILQVRTSEALDNKRAKEGTPLEFTVIRDVAVNGMLAIPRGATVRGVVTGTKNSGELSGSPELALALTSLDLGGRSYPLQTDKFKVRGPNKAEHTAGNIIGGALLGAIIGGAAGGGGGAAIGAAAGGTVGTAASAASSGPRAWIPAEALVTFHLNTPVTVDPVSPQEAARLAQGLYPGGPTLYRRPGYGPRFAPAYYAYPPVYYRPYYVVGGSYYWR